MHDTNTESDACQANGCPLHGTVSYSLGEWVCTAHARIERSEWDAVTFKIRQDRNRAFQAAVHRCKQLPSDHEWHLYASRKFSPELQPQPDESRALWLYRMFYEWLYRVGVRDTPSRQVRPQGEHIKRPEAPSFDAYAMVAAIRDRQRKQGTTHAHP